MIKKQKGIASVAILTLAVIFIGGSIVCDQIRKESAERERQHDMQEIAKIVAQEYAD